LLIAIVVLVAGDAALRVRGGFAAQTLVIGVAHRDAVRIGLGPHFIAGTIGCCLPISNRMNTVMFRRMKADASLRRKFAWAIAYRPLFACPTWRESLRSLGTCEN